MQQKNPLSNRIFSLIAKADEPLETREVEQLLEKAKHGETRVKVLYRLNLLRGEGKIKGKAVGSGKGTWIWWEAGKE